MKGYCPRVVNQKNGSMLQLGDWMSIFPLWLFLIINFLRVSHLPHSLSQNIVQLANLLRLRISFSRLGTEFIRDSNDDILLKYYYGFCWGLKVTQERKDWKETQQGVTKKQRNTTHHRGAYINTSKSDDGIANMSAVHYSNPQQVIVSLKIIISTLQEDSLGIVCCSCSGIICFSFDLLDCAWKKALMKTFYHVIYLLGLEDKRFL